MEIIILTFLLKLIDNALGTLKTIFLNKEKYFFSALSNSFGTFFYLFAIVQISKSNSIAGILAACVATFIGTYVPGKVVNKFEKNKLYVFDITSDTLEKGKEFGNIMRDLNLAINTNPWTNNEMEKVLCAKIYCKTKQEVMVVLEKMPDTFKWNVDTSLSSFE